MAFKRAYSEEQQINSKERRMNYERQNTTLTEKSEKLRKLLAFSLA